MSRRNWLDLAMVAVILTSIYVSPAVAGEENAPMVRLAKLVIHEAHLEAYRAQLAEEIRDSVRLEPGVRTLFAVSEKDRPTHFTILEIYADTTAYQDHLKSPHFLKYKTATEGMVQSLELIDAVPGADHGTCAPIALLAAKLFWFDTLVQR